MSEDQKNKKKKEKKRKNGMCFVCLGLWVVSLILFITDDTDDSQSMPKKARPDNAGNDELLIKQVYQALDETKEEASNLRSTVEAKDQLIKQLQTEVQESELKAESLELMVENNSVDIKELRHVNNELESSLVSAKKEIEFLRSEIKKFVSSGPINIKTGKQVVLGVSMQCGHHMELDDLMHQVGPRMFVAEVVNNDEKNEKKKPKVVQLTINMNQPIRVSCPGNCGLLAVELKKVEPFLNPNAQYLDHTAPEFKQSLFVVSRPVMEKSSSLLKSIVFVNCPHCKTILQPSKAISHLSACPSLTVEWKDIISVFGKKISISAQHLQTTKINQTKLVLNMSDSVDAFGRVANFALMFGKDAQYPIEEKLVWNPFDFLVHFLVENNVINVVQRSKVVDFEEGQNPYEVEAEEEQETSDEQEPVLLNEIEQPNVANLLKEIPWLKQESQKMQKLMLFPFFARRIIAETASTLDHAFRSSLLCNESMLIPMYRNTIKDHKKFVNTLMSLYCYRDNKYRNCYLFVDSDNEDDDDESPAHASTSSSSSSSVSENE